MTMILPVFQDRIYWTDRDRAAVFMANRLTGQDIQTLAENLNDPHDIVVFHQLRQPPGVCTVAERGRLCARLLVCFLPSLWLCEPSHISATVFPAWVHDDPGTWINDIEAFDCGGVIKAVGAAAHSHICQNSASNPIFFNRTIQIWVELNRALNHDCDGCVLPFLCVTFHIYLCLSVSSYLFLPSA